MITLQIKGEKEVSQKLQRLARGTWPALTVALDLEAKKILQTSQTKYVPVVEGDLRDSGYVKPSTHSHNTVRVNVGYSSPYAKVTHENPRAGKTSGRDPSGRSYKQWSTVGSWKFLEHPMNRAALGMARRLGKIINLSWSRLVK